MTLKQRLSDSSSPSSSPLLSSSLPRSPLPNYPFDFDSPSVKQFSTSNSEYLDSLHLLGFSVYEWVTFIHLILGHWIVWRYIYSPSWTFQFLLWSIQFSLAAYFYNHKFSHYIDESRGGLRGPARFRLDPPPGFEEPQATQSSDPDSTANDSAAPPPLLFGRQTSSFVKLNSPDINPFVNNTFWITRRECLRLSLASVTLFPVRLLVATIALCSIAAVGKLAMLGLGSRDMKKPLPPLRRALMRLPILILARVILLASGYYWISTKGRKAPTEEAPIIVSNHVTFLEPVYLISQYLASPIAAAENLKAPILSTITLALQTILVDRNDSSSRSAVVDTMKTRAKERGWPTTIVFPEGSCTNGRYLIQFKPGAFIVGKPVQPIAVNYPCGSRISPSWSSSVNSVLMLLIRILCEPFNRMNVYFLPVYNPSAEEIADVTLYANNVREVLQRVLRQPAIQCTVEDMQLAQKLWTPIVDRVGPKRGEIAMYRSKVSNIELAKAKSIVPQLDWGTILMHLKRFQLADTEYQGVLYLAGFAKSLNRPESPEFKRFFQWLNHDGSGTVHFMEFLIGIALFANGTVDQALQSTFQVYSKNGKDIDYSSIQWLWNAIHSAQSDKLESVWKSNYSGRSAILEAEWMGFGKEKFPDIVDALRRVFVAAVPERKRDSKEGKEKETGSGSGSGSAGRKKE